MDRASLGKIDETIHESMDARIRLGAMVRVCGSSRLQLGNAHGWSGLHQAFLVNKKCTGTPGYADMRATLLLNFRFEHALHTLHGEVSLYRKHGD